MSPSIVSVTIVAPSEIPGELAVIAEENISAITAIFPEGTSNALAATDQDVTVSLVMPPEPVPANLIMAYVPVPGPPGPAGPPGTGGDKNYLHTQNAASNTWVINHNLAKFPSIKVLDSSGNEVYGAVNHIDINTAIVTFSVPFGGTATCN